MILGLGGMWVRRSYWREDSIFYAQFVLFAAITGVFVGATSYRAYLDVYWIVFAAGFIAAFDVPQVRPLHRFFQAETANVLHYAELPARYRSMS